MDDVQVRAMNIDLDALNEFKWLMEHSHVESFRDYNMSIWDAKEVLALARARTNNLYDPHNIQSIAFHDWIGVINGGRVAVSAVFAAKKIIEEAKRVKDIDEGIAAGAVETVYGRK